MKALAFSLGFSLLNSKAGVYWKPDVGIEVRSLKRFSLRSEQITIFCSKGVAGSRAIGV